MNRISARVAMTVCVSLALVIAIVHAPAASGSPGAHLTADSDITTVLTCESLDFGLDPVLGTMKSTLSGFAKSHGTPVRVPTVSDLSWAGLLRGRDQLDAYIRKTPGKKIVFGYSRGAQIASEWLREYASKAGAPPTTELSFVFICNPQRRLGGSLGKTGDGVQLRPAPDTTQYTVTDLSRRWDGWSNADNWPAGPNPGATSYLNTIGRWVIHSNYQNVSINDPANQVRSTVGNTTYVVTP